MADKTIKCTSCGAPITRIPGKRSAICEYCGSEIMLNKEEYAVSLDEEKRIKEAEKESAIQQKKEKATELENQQHKSRKRMMAIFSAMIFVCVISTIFVFSLADEDNKFYGVLILGLIEVIVMGGYFLFKKVKKEQLHKYTNLSGITFVPLLAENFSWVNYVEVVKELRRAGFTDVTAEPLKNLRMAAFRQNMTARVSINGDAAVVSGSKYPIDSKVIVYYNSVRK